MENLKDTKKPQKIKKPWLPKSRAGIRALVFSSLAIAWGILIPIMPFPDWFRGGIPGASGGLSRVLLLVVLLVLGFYFLYKTIFKVKDRAILILILFVLFCLIAGFWIFFSSANLSLRIKSI